MLVYFDLSIIKWRSIIVRRLVRWFCNNKPDQRFNKIVSMHFLSHPVLYGANVNEQFVMYGCMKVYTVLDILLIFEIKWLFHYLANILALYIFLRLSKLPTIKWWYWLIQRLSVKSIAKFRERYLLIELVKQAMVCMISNPYE